MKKGWSSKLGRSRDHHSLVNLEPKPPTSALNKSNKLKPCQNHFISSIWAHLNSELKRHLSHVHIPLHTCPSIFSASMCLPTWPRHPSVIEHGKWHRQTAPNEICKHHDLGSRRSTKWGKTRDVCWMKPVIGRYILQKPIRMLAKLCGYQTHSGNTWTLYKHDQPSNICMA